MAEPENDYSWVFGLVVLFFVIVLPILKKVADAIGGKKPQQPFQRPGPPRKEPEKRGAVQEMLDGVEDFFRRTRTEGGPEQKTPPAEMKKPRETAPFDTWYQQRKGEIEERRQRRSQRRQRSRLELVGDKQFEPTRIEPVIQEEPEGLVVIEEPSRQAELSSIVRKDGHEPPPESEKEESFFDVLGELPEMARLVVASEILSPPKSMQSAEGVF